MTTIHTMKTFQTFLLLFLSMATAGVVTSASSLSFQEQFASQEQSDSFQEHSSFQEHPRSLQSPQCGKALAFQETPCLEGLVNDIVIPDKCTDAKIISIIMDEFRKVKDTCEWDFGYEIRLLTGTFTLDKARIVIQGICQQAEDAMWARAPAATWTGDIDPLFTPSFMDDHTDGAGFLNERIGNFVNSDGSDPLQNEFYPSDAESVAAGKAIDAFYMDGATTKVLEPVDHLNNCAHQTMMCCFGRDRQYGDGNGTCRRRTCEPDTAKPADNTNICFDRDDSGNARNAYPKDEMVHCHGIAWGEDMTDASARLRFNNFFYVLMHDHLYSRGYVEPAVPDTPMCSCVEDMPVVARADCSEELMLTDYYVSVAGEAIQVRAGELEFRFRACQGTAIVSGQEVKKNNDLAAKVTQLWLDGEMSESTREAVFKTVVGYKQPEDEVNEFACKSAWADETNGAEYVAKSDDM